MTTRQFDEEWESLKKDPYCNYDSFEYIASSGLKETVTLHFQRVKRSKRHGVYVIRRQSTREVLYIGKSGTIKQRGEFKGQDIPGRLKRKRGKSSAQEWFSRLAQKEPLDIEYVFLTPTPKSPALVEAMLLQAYLNENGDLPLYNKAF